LTLHPLVEPYAAASQQSFSNSHLLAVTVVYNKRRRVMPCKAVSIERIANITAMKLSGGLLKYFLGAYLV
jgi:hypothetical protein